MSETYTIERILEGWLKFRQENSDLIMKCLKHEDKEIKLAIPKDDSCELECLTNKKDYQLNLRCCKQCLILSNLFYKKVVDEGVALAPLFTQYSLDENGKEEIAYVEKAIKPEDFDRKEYISSSKFKRSGKICTGFGYKKDEDSKKILNVLQKKVATIHKFEQGTVNESYITDNKHINYATISILISYIMNYKNFDHYPPFEMIYSCGNHFNIVNKIPDLGIGSLKEIKDNKHNHASPLASGAYKRQQLNKQTVLSIVKQLTCVIKFLTHFNFNHGMPSINYIGFQSDKIECEYQNVSYSSDFKLFIIPCQYSSITIKRTTNSNDNYYNFRYVSDIHNVQPILPVQTTQIYLFNDDKLGITLDPDRFKKYKIPYMSKNEKSDDIHEKFGFRDKEVFCYVIGNKIEEYLDVTKYNGIPIFGQSFNFICFLISLLKDEMFYNSFMEHTGLVELWEGLWRQEKDLPFIIEKLSNREEENDFTTVLNIIRDVYIRIDALEYFMEGLSKL